MKILYLIRHAETEIALPGQRDRDRLLTASGEQDAAALAKKLSQHLKIPDLFLASTAKRALQTAEIIRKTWPCEEVLFQQEALIYEKTYQELFNYLQQLSNKYTIVAVCGHNPTLSLLTDFFLDDKCRLETANCVAITFDIAAWRELFYHTGQKIGYFNSL